MLRGHRIGERFEIESKAGTGGMGTVFRARDRDTGELVAVKVLHQSLAAEMDRFSREVRLLSELSQTFDSRDSRGSTGPGPKYPAVARYVAHGMTDWGAPYLVMEWLEGQSLDKRLRSARLTLSESVELAGRVARALSVLHAVGIVHRDIKPSNLFLCDGRIATVKLIDFGIARPRQTATGMTHTGVAVGTPGYMAPEQVRGEPDVGAPADVFSLGCVLFECLTGRPAFEGAHVMAVLAKLLLDEAPPLRMLCPSVPEDLEALVWRMLSKDAVARPADGTALLEELSALVGLGMDLGLSYDASSPTGQFIRIRRNLPKPPPALTSGEQRLVSVLLVAAMRSQDPSQTSSGDAELADDRDDASADLPISGLRKPSEVDQALRSIVAEHGAVLDRLADGTRLLALASASVATDQAAQAAQCALSMRSILPAAPMALATGRGRVGGHRLIGEVIDRAVRMLETARAERTADAPAKTPILIDELTAGLLKVRFHVDSRADQHLLRSEREPVGTAGMVLGRPTSCVGRDRELLMLEATLDQCIAESSSRAVLVMARAGVGKSRLCREFVERVRARDEPVSIWVARGDPMQAGAPLGLLGQMIRRAARVVEGEPIAVRRQKLMARATRRIATPRAAQVAEFLGEVAAVPFLEEESTQLRAARQDATLRSEQMRRAWIDFVDAECRLHPVLLILEELHWADRSTIEYVDAALRLLREQPLMVLSLARPEVVDLFPKLWADRDLQQMRLGELSRKACEKLSRAVLGERATPETLTKLWERSGGNAFFLEELLRAISDGREDDVPDTVLAMVQSRLAGLSPEARRILRAGSVFGEVFWRGGAAALLGERHRIQALRSAIAVLLEREWIFERPDTTFPGEPEYAFRHALVRDAAYGMLTDDDRVLGHKLAGDWLERAGARNATVVADHFERGQAPERAVEWHHRAAEQALDGGDLDAALKRVERAISCGARGEVLDELNRIQAEAHGRLSRRGEV
jgi:serine/threonine protein kinase